MSIQSIAKKEKVSGCGILNKKKPFISSTAIQRKLSIGSANDSFEQEADTVANKVLSMSDAQVSSNLQTTSRVQRKCTACEERENIQKKSLVDGITPLIQ